MQKNFKIGISFKESDLHLTEDISDLVLVDKNRFSEETHIEHALESKISDNSLKKIKEQLLNLCNNKKYVSRYAHINQIFDFSLIPIVAYLETIHNYNQIYEGNMEIILPTNYVFPSRELSLLLAEGEKRFSFMYSRSEAFSYYIKLYCKSNNIKIHFVKRNFFPFSAALIIRRIIIKFGKFLEDIRISLLNQNIPVKNISKKNIIFLDRTNPEKLFNHKEFKNQDSICFASESSSLLNANIIEFHKRNSDHVLRMPHPGLVSTLLSYLRKYPKDNYQKSIKIFGIDISMRNILKEADILNPSLEIYLKRLELIGASKNATIISTELKSAHAAVEYLFSSKHKNNITFFQLVDSHIRISPKYVFGGHFEPYSDLIGKMILNKNPEIKIIDVKSRLRNEHTDIKGNGDSIIFFDTEMDDLNSRDIIENEIIRFSRNNNKEYLKYRHPRDKFADKKTLNISLSEKIKDAEVVFTYPSAIIFELIKFNVPIVVLFIGIGKDAKWHFSYSKEYQGCITAINEIKSIDLESIKKQYVHYIKELYE